MFGAQQFLWSFHNLIDSTSCRRFALAWQLSRQTSPETGKSLVNVFAILCEFDGEMLLFQIRWVFVYLQHGRSPEEAYCTHMHTHPWWAASEVFFFIHCAINHFSFSQTLTTRSEMLFLALNVLLWNVAVRPYSSYFLHPAGFVSRLQNPSSSSLLLHWAE